MLVIVSVWMGMLLAVLACLPALLAWHGRVERPQIGQDGLLWRMRHVGIGVVWGGMAWLLVVDLLGVPLFALLVLLLFEDGGWPLFLELLLFVPFVVLGGALLWPFLWLPFAWSELRASPDGLVWKRRWPLKGRTWSWNQLRHVAARDGRLSLDAEGGECWQLRLPGTDGDDLEAVCAALEATRTAPPPQSQPAPEVPAELRSLREQRQ